MRQPVTALILIGLLILGTEMLRRQVAREFPDADLSEATQRWRDRLSGVFDRSAQRKASSSLEPAGDEAGNRIEQLERLTKLRDAGVLDESEFSREKQLVLEGGAATSGGGS
jgi:hypothetical protein